VTATLLRREPPETPADSGSRRLTERVFRIRESGIIVVLALFVAVTAGVQHRFVSETNIQFILVNTTIFALLALGETMVVISRNVDLSVGSVLGMSAYLSASLFGGHHGIPIPLVFAVGLGIGLGWGIVNGLLVAAGRVPSLVVTLATLYIIRGVDILIVGGGMVTANTLPGSFTGIPKATVLGIPDLAIAVAVIIAAGAYYLRSFRSGRELYAIGSNPEAARLAGLPVGKRVLFAFAVSGAGSGRGGRAVGCAVRHGRLDGGDQLRADGDHRRGRRRGGDLRRQRQRGRRRARRAAAFDHQLRPLRPRRLGLLGSGDLRLPAHPRHQHRPDHLGQAHRGPAAKE
jgi:rhamnose transport system permease protein